MEIVAIIPARGGSKRLPGKNIKKLAGKPLISYTIEAARNAGIGSVIVSTDDEEIAKVSRMFGSKVIKRPESLAQDDTPTLSVVRHALETLKFEGHSPDIIVLLQPTSPLRNSGHIRNALDMYNESRKNENMECDAVASVCHIKNALESSNGFLDISGIGKTRYKLNGAIFILSREAVEESWQWCIGKRTVPYVMEEKDSIDIDIEGDFKLAEYYMRITNNE